MPVALITGASRGIGAAIAHDLAAHGFSVVVNYRQSAQEADEVVRSIAASGGEARAECADVSSSDACNALRERLAAEGRHVDVLVNNAGIVRDRSFRKMTEDEWAAVMDTNLGGAVNCSRAFAPGMIERRSGHIVNVSSIVGQVGAFGQTNYATAKSGLLGFTKSLSLELAPYGITVNAVCPGYIETGMWRSIPENVQQTILATIPLRRTGQPREVASCVRYLVTEGSYITGQAINVNGGVLRAG